MNINQPAVRWLVLALVVLVLSGAAPAQIAVGISVRIGPPALPVYAQPICPGPGFYWVPGYWAWNDAEGYYWVPGTWVMAPVGMLWTPGWWGWSGGFYAWHAGYWGPHIGFYGGINYGYGYTGVGFVGGEWRSGAFYYNRAVTNVSVTNVTNVYNKTVIVNNTTVNNVSFNGGTGGVQARPTQQEQAAMSEPHTALLTAQTRHETLASQNRQNFASVNQGKPAIAATAKAGDFSGRSVIPARSAGGEYHPPTMSPQQARGPSVPGYHPVTPASTTTPNRPVSGTPAPASSQGFRPFTPPSSSTANRPSGTATPAVQSGPKTSNGFHPFTPPSSGQSQNPHTGNTPSNPSYQGKGASGNNPSYAPGNKPANVPQSSAPKSNSTKPTPQPHSQPHKPSPPPPPKENPRRSGTLSR